MEEDRSMTTFKEARAAVKRELMLDSEPRGYEDAEDFNVLVRPPFHDEVVLVTKESGEVHREIYFQQLARLQSMTEVFDEEPFNPGEQISP
jgi:hypothetical protein